ncbi:hypothetical protein RP20_CCG009711 [Aedes albopictus]|nr:uncharacterized protein LOC115267592 [Aedes albopictus]KXJ76374.1 hypothetical protein RP20_CCG009711 [Aedes albopictus]
MAKLLSYYSLCPINDVREFLGLSRDVDTGCVINTLGRNIIQVVKLSNQKLQHSWTSLDRLTSKVVYDFRSERYVAVFGNRQVRCWNRDQSDINKVKKLKFFRSILELFTLDNGQVLVLYDDGSCESLESAVDTRNEDRKDPENILKKPNIDSVKETILNVTAITVDSGDTILAYFVKDQEEETLTLNYALLEKESLKPLKGFHKIKLQRIEQKVHLVGQSIVDGSAGPSLITIWSDKRIFSKPLTFDDEAHHKSIGNFISILSMINTSQPLSMIGISKDYVAIYANNLNQDGATLLLYNVQFKVVQAKQLFKVYFNNSRFWLSENHILLAFGQTLAVVPFKISKEQLSDMVGTQRSIELRSYVDNESINEDCDFNEGFAFVGNLESVVDEESDEEDSKPERVYKIFESIETFEESLRKVYKSNLQVDVLRDESLPDDTIQMRLMANVDNSLGPLVFSEKFEIFVSELEKHGFCEMEITDKVLPLMIEANASLDIGKCLKRYSTVSERALVSVLQYALACNDQPPSGTKITDLEQLLDRYEESAIPASNPSEEIKNLDILECHDVEDSSRNDLLNIVLSCSFNRRTILPLVRNEIDLNAVLRLLDHLLHLLTDPVSSLMDSPTNCDNFNSDDKVVEWATLLIDSHYQQIILSRDGKVRERMVNWMNVVKQHSDSLQELKSLAPAVLRLVEKKTGEGEKHVNKWYSVETVQLY